MIDDTGLNVTYNSKAKSSLIFMSFCLAMGSVSGEGCGVGNNIVEAHCCIIHERKSSVELFS